MADQVRVLRLIEYAGDRDWVEDQLKRSIQGSRIVGGRGIITVTTLTEFPDHLRELDRTSLVNALAEIKKLEGQLKVAPR